jgi:protease-4
VDRLGGLPEAIESAAKRAELEEGYRVFYVEEKRSLRDRILERLLSAKGTGALPASSASPVAAGLRSIENELGRLALWNDPKGLYGHCLCGEEWP